VTTTTSTTSSTSTPSATSTILQTLNAGSGIDTSSLVTELVQAEFASQTDSLQSQSDSLTAQISGVAQLQSGITSFSAALQSLINGGTLTTQPTVSDSTVLSATALSGAQLSNLSAQVEVTRLATAQSVATATSFASSDATIGTGNLTLTFGNATVADGAMTDFTAGSAAPISIAIDSDHSSVSGIASAINAAKAGVTASVVTDADGSARLVLKGTTGSAQAFTLSGDTPELQQLNVGVGESATTVNSAALNAQIKYDGVAVERATNTVSDLVPGVKLNLLSASPGKPVTLGSSTPTDALSQAVGDFVDTYNTYIALVTGDTDAATGTLRQDTAVQAMQQQLQGLTGVNLTGDTSGAPTTLAQIGVTTNRDGTLSVDNTQLATALNSYPDAVEAMFRNGTTATGGGLAGALGAIATAATSTTYGLAASTTRYTAQQSDITDQQSDLQSQEDDMTTRLTSQFSNMDAAVAAYKSTQTFLQQQLDAWNNKNN
jgi:flagellar hook-associated protein 2